MASRWSTIFLTISILSLSRVIIQGQNIYQLTPLDIPAATNSPVVTKIIYTSPFSPTEKPSSKTVLTLGFDCQEADSFIFGTNPTAKAKVLEDDEEKPSTQTLAAPTTNANNLDCYPVGGCAKIESDIQFTSVYLNILDDINTYQQMFYSQVNNDVVVYQSKPEFFLIDPTERTHVTLKPESLGDQISGVLGLKFPSTFLEYSNDYNYLVKFSLNHASSDVGYTFYYADVPKANPDQIAQESFFLSLGDEPESLATEIDYHIATPINHFGTTLMYLDLDAIRLDGEEFSLQPADVVFDFNYPYIQMPINLFDALVENRFHVFKEYKECSFDYGVFVCTIKPNHYLVPTVSLVIESKVYTFEPDDYVLEIPKNPEEEDPDNIEYYYVVGITKSSSEANVLTLGSLFAKHFPVSMKIKLHTVYMGFGGGTHMIVSGADTASIIVIAIIFSLLFFCIIFLSFKKHKRRIREAEEERESLESDDSERNPLSVMNETSKDSSQIRYSSGNYTGDALMANGQETSTLNGFGELNGIHTNPDTENGGNTNQVGGRTSINPTDN